MDLECSCCKQDRLKAEKPPRILKVAPVSTAKKNLAVYVCEHCDPEINLSEN